MYTLVITSTLDETYKKLIKGNREKKTDKENNKTHAEQSVLSITQKSQG